MDTTTIKRTRKPREPKKKEKSLPTYEEDILDLPPSPPKLVREVKKSLKKATNSPRETNDSVDIPCDDAESCPVAKVRKNNAWIEHVKAYRLEHPDLSYTAAMKEAKETYRK